MLVYNLTIKVDHTIADEWLQWQVEAHVPEVMATDLFLKNHSFKLLEQDETDGPTYVFQFVTDSREKYLSYINDYAPSLREKAFLKWGNTFVVFETVLQTVH